VCDVALGRTDNVQLKCHEQVQIVCVVCTDQWLDIKIIYYPNKVEIGYQITGCLLAKILSSHEGEYQDIVIRECNYPEHGGSNFPRNGIISQNILLPHFIIQQYSFV
jgi:hypothetical protein